MGTRGVVGFRFDQKEVLFYNHWDSYPDGLGQDVVYYVKSVNDWNEIRDQVVAFVPVNDGDVPTTAQKARANELGTVNLNVSRQSEDDFYCLTREAQGDIGLQLELGFGTMATDFVRDSLFCEFAYIINLDTMELEFYKGFNEDRNADGRYAWGDDEEYAEHGYAGIALVGEAPLSAIPDDWIARFYPEPEEE